MPDPLPGLAATSTQVAVVLPPREGFGPGYTGAIGMLVQRLATGGSAFAPAVIGGRPRGAVFPGVAYHEARLPLGLPARDAIPYAFAVAATLRRLRQALVEVHNRPQVARLLAWLLPDIPVGLFLHNDPRRMEGSRSVRSRRILLDRLAAVVVVSAFIRTCLLDGVGAPARDPYVLANCIDLSALPVPPMQRDRSIVFAGRLVAEKGPDVLVAACARALPGLPGWRATLIGGDRFRADAAETGFIRTLRPLAEAAGVAMTGYQPHDAVLAALSRAAIAVVPSRWDDPFPLAALEAMASGAALVCTRRGGLPEMAGAAALYVASDDAADLAAALTALATDPARLAALSAAGMARARHFDLPVGVAALDALRREILAR